MKEAEAGTKTAQLALWHSLPEVTIYKRSSKYGGLRRLEAGGFLLISGLHRMSERRECLDKGSDRACGCDNDRRSEKALPP